MIQLIGGRLVDGELRRDVTLAPLRGRAELALAELSGSGLSGPEKVSVFLSETVETVGGAPLSRAEADSLSVGDRQHLVRQIGAAMGRDQLWLSAPCEACGEMFDVSIHQSHMPVKPASTAYPAAPVRVGRTTVAVRAPTGADQMAVMGLDAAEALPALLRRLIDRPDAIRLTERTRARLEAAIEDMAPEVALHAAAQCPECGADNHVPVDPYLTLGLAGEEIFDEIHILARAYHWAEDAILEMPRARRKRYLARIDREKGVAASPPEGRAG